MYLSDDHRRMRFLFDPDDHEDDHEDDKSTSVPQEPQAPAEEAVQRRSVVSFELHPSLLLEEYLDRPLDELMIPFDDVELLESLARMRVALDTTSGGDDDMKSSSTVPQ